jgi:hypothetical protein
MSEAISRQKQVPATGSHPTGRIREGDESVVADRSQVFHAKPARTVARQGDGRGGEVSRPSISNDEIKTPAENERPWRKLIRATTW